MRLLSWTLLCVLALHGCGEGTPDDQPDLGTVTGKVTMDDKPLEKATVTFEPVEGGRPSTGETDADGMYELQYSPSANGAKIGKHRVRVSTATTVSDDSGNDVNVAETVPDKYNKKTELEKEVKAGSNEIDLPLDSNGAITDDDDGGNRRDRDTCG